MDIPSTYIPNDNLKIKQVVSPSRFYEEEPIKIIKKSNLKNSEILFN